MFNKKKKNEPKELPEDIVLFGAIDTYRVIWLSPHQIEEHNHKFYIPLIGWYTTKRGNRGYTASLTKINGKLFVNPGNYTVRPNTDYAIQYPDQWIEVNLVYDQELPFDE